MNHNDKVLVGDVWEAGVHGAPNIVVIIITNYANDVNYKVLSGGSGYGMVKKRVLIGEIGDAWQLIHRNEQESTIDSNKLLEQMANPPQVTDEDFQRAKMLHESTQKKDECEELRLLEQCIEVLKEEADKKLEIAHPNIHGYEMGKSHGYMRCIEVIREYREKDLRGSDG